MNRRTFLSTLIGTEITSLTDWDGPCHGDHSSDQSRTDPPSIDEFLIHADDLGDSYEAQRPKQPPLPTPVGEQAIIQSRTSTRVPWDAEETLQYNKLQTRSVAPVNAQSETKAAESSPTERAALDSWVLQPVADNTTPAKLHRLRLWDTFGDSNPSFEQYTDWIDTEYATHDTPYPRTDILIRTPVMYSPPAAPLDDPRPHGERATIIGTLPWGVTQLVFTLRYAPEYGQTLGGLRPIMNALHQQAAANPAPPTASPATTDPPREQAKNK